MSYDFSKLKNYLDTKIVGKMAPGVDIAVIYKGDEVFRYTVGYADEENKVKLTKDHLFDIYSATKVITCTAGFIAIEQGLFLPGDPVSWYIPEIDNLTYYKTETEVVKNDKIMVIQDLFCMSAGFDYDCGCKEIRDVVAKNPNANTEEVIKAFLTRPLKFRPKERYCYSMCHDVLALVIEKASGMRFADFVKKYIFDPLDMKDAYFHLPESEKHRKSAKYTYNDQTKKYERRSSDNDYFVPTNMYDSGGAGVVTNLNEYSKIAYALTHGGVGKNGNKIISAQSIAHMRTNLLDEQRLKIYHAWSFNNPGYGYGYGVRVKMEKGLTSNFASGEFGWDGAAGFMACFEPELDLAIIYAQHVLNPHNYENHNRIKNFVHLALFD